MNLHDADVTARFSSFLDRKSFPRRLDGKPQAQDAEMRALITLVTRFAPRSTDALAAWWPIFESELSVLSGDYWPSEKHIKPAASQASKDAPKLRDITGGPDVRDVAVTARKLQRNEPVGESWLWGRGAVELIAEGLVDEATMREYRSRAFLARRAFYGEAEALAWEVEAKARHDAARAVHRGRRDPSEQRNIEIPDKSAPYSPDAFAA